MGFAGECIKIFTLCFETSLGIWNNGECLSPCVRSSDIESDIWERILRYLTASQAIRVSRQRLTCSISSFPTQVRVCMCEQLTALAAAVGPEQSTSTLLPELQVRLAPYHMRKLAYLHRKPCISPCMSSALHACALQNTRASLALFAKICSPPSSDALLTPVCVTLPKGSSVTPPPLALLAARTDRRSARPRPPPPESGRVRSSL